MSKAHRLLVRCEGALFTLHRSIMVLVHIHLVCPLHLCPHISLTMFEFRRGKPQTDWPYLFGTRGRFHHSVRLFHAGMKPIGGRNQALRFHLETSSALLTWGLFQWREISGFN